MTHERSREQLRWVDAEAAALVPLDSPARVYPQATTVTCRPCANFYGLRSVENELDPWLPDAEPHTHAVNLTIPFPRLQDCRSALRPAKVA